MEKTLLVGATGQVGTQMLETLQAQRGTDGVLPTARGEHAESPGQRWLPLDLAELASEAEAETLLAGESLDRVLCVGGMTWVDGCESRPELAERTNARGPAALAAYAQRRGLPFVYFSTDYVFDGSAESPGPYDELARPRPLSVYGRTKLEGEQSVRASHPGALILRTTWVYGPDSRQKNYLYQMIRNLRSGQAMKVPEDQVSTPSYNRDLAAVMDGLLAAGATGVFHVAGPERMTRLEFARRTAEWLGLDAELLQPVTTAELAAPAARPLLSGLLNSRLQREHPAQRTRGLQECLADCGDDLKAFLAQAG